MDYTAVGSPNYAGPLVDFGGFLRSYNNARYPQGQPRSGQQQPTPGQPLSLAPPNPGGQGGQSGPANGGANTLSPSTWAAGLRRFFTPSQAQAAPGPQAAPPAAPTNQATQGGAPLGGLAAPSLWGGAAPNIGVGFNGGAGGQSQMPQNFDPNAVGALY